MTDYNVGASILNIITESLYDRPIVVFREYVQNSADSFRKTPSIKNLKSNIWNDDKNLYFLDNGNGISERYFENEMVSIASSGKNRISNIGYKGIGRLSGLSYCEKLEFVNIRSFKNQQIQIFTIDCLKYNAIKDSDEYLAMQFKELMNTIGHIETASTESRKSIFNIINKYEDMFATRDTGFLVILHNINFVLKHTIEEKNIYIELGWMLPVKFKDELKNIKEKKLFKILSNNKSNGVVPAKYYEITFNNQEIERPITKKSLREFTCQTDIKYGVAFYSFNSTGISIDKNNVFSGIKVYIDNMLLCDENELLPMLNRYGFLENTVNELIQTVRGLGVVIYITDKINISSNARRTFIEVTDNDALDFLEIISALIKQIYNARYAVSKYNSANKNLEFDKEKLRELREKAEQALAILALDKVKMEDNSENVDRFDKLSITEKKQILKRTLSKTLSEKLRNYVSQVTTVKKSDINNAFESFKTWLIS